MGWIWWRKGVWSSRFLSPFTVSLLRPFVSIHPKDLSFVFVAYLRELTQNYLSQHSYSWASVNPKDLIFSVPLIQGGKRDAQKFIHVYSYFQTFSLELATWKSSDSRSRIWGLWGFSHNFITICLLSSMTRLRSLYSKKLGRGKHAFEDFSFPSSPSLAQHALFCQKSCLFISHSPLSKYQWFVFPITASG